MEELLEHEGDVGRGADDDRIMSSVLLGATVADAVEALPRGVRGGDPDTITEVYLLDEAEHLKGVVPLAQLLMAQPGTAVATLSKGTM